MPQVILHHITIVATDLDRSVAFYQNLFGFARLERPPFKIRGAWLATGDYLQLHVLDNPEGTFRTGGVDINDVHFAFRTDDFEGVLSRLIANGFSEDAPEADLKRLIVFKTGLAGFAQLYLLDPDRNIVEVNRAPRT